MKHTVCTLFEGDYHLGAAALINSLHRQGFDGTFICGYRGPLPRWHSQSEKLPSIDIRWVALDPPVHFTNYKSAFLQTCWETHTPSADQIYYIDPDIIVKAQWSVIARWAADGIALCEDVNHYLPARHPLRLAWGDFFNAHQLTSVRSIERYYNAGFIGLSRDQKDILRHWQRLIDLGGQHLGHLDRIKSNNANDLFHTIDQDALNMALLLGHWQINAAGPSAMDFECGGHLLSHAQGGVKPWQKKFIRSALGGRPPSRADRTFWQAVQGPIQAFDKQTITRRRLSLNVAAIIGRFWRSY